MEHIKIQTTQNVDINYELASIGDRIVATLLDYVFFIAYFLLVFLIASLTKFNLFENYALSTLLVLPILLYDLICELFMEGKTFGKTIMKIKVVKLDGTQPTFGSYFLRWVLRIIDTKIFSGGIAILTIFLNEKGQRIGDMAAGTTVIKFKQKVTLNDTILTKSKPNQALTFPEVSKLSDTDISIIKEVVQLSIKTNNHQAIEKLAKKTKEVMGVDSKIPNAQFLKIVLEDYNNFSFER